MKKSNLVEDFQGLSEWLQRYRALWTSQPFLHKSLDWEQDYPEIAFALRGLSDQQMEDYERQAWNLPLEDPNWCQWLNEASNLVRLPNVSVEKTTSKPPPVKIRKWQQITLLIDAILSKQNISFWVDWCGGKGHLLRSFIQSGNVSGMVIERNQKLCDDGMELAAKVQLENKIKFHCADVVTDTLPSQIFRQSGVVALHACGQLTDIAIRNAVGGGADSLVLVPCCYHLQPGNWQPISEMGRAVNMDLKKHTLRLPSMLEKSLRPRRRKLRFRQLAYRMAFANIFASAGEEIPHLPSYPRRLFYLDFPSFCAKVSADIKVEIPTNTNLEESLSHGWRTSGLARRLGLIHTPFRRAIELWLNMDRALFLEGKGYDCQILELCDPSVTPRNMVIRATRNS